MNEAPHDYRLIFEHWRVLRFVKPAPKGRPDPLALCRWSRKMGWLTRDGEPMDLARKTDTPFERGGMTIAKFLDPYGEVLCLRRAICSMEDNFSYKRGRDIALGRLRASGILDDYNYEI